MDGPFDCHHWSFECRSIGCRKFSVDDEERDVSPVTLMVNNSQKTNGHDMGSMKYT